MLFTDQSKRTLPLGFLCSHFVSSLHSLAPFIESTIWRSRGPRKVTARANLIALFVFASSRADKQTSDGRPSDSDLSRSRGFALRPVYHAESANIRAGQPLISLVPLLDIAHGAHSASARAGRGKLSPYRESAAQRSQEERRTRHLTRFTLYTTTRRLDFVLIDCDWGVEAIERLL